MSVKPAAGSGARLTAAVFAVGLSLTAPAVALADTAGTGDTDTATQSAETAGHRAAARTARPQRVDDDGNRTPRSASRTPATAAATAPDRRASSHREHAPRANPARVATATPRTARIQQAETQQAETPAPQALPVTEPVVTEPVTVPGPPAEAATPSALAVASAPPANATGSGDLFSGLLAPIQSFFEGIGLLVKRTFFNEAPTVAPVQTTGQLTGPITGSVGAVDPEGDPLTYAVTETPRFGTVVVGADGSYVYTPGADFTGLDSFNVAVTDTGFHINLLDLTRPASTEAFLQVAQNATLPMLTFSFIYGSGSQFWSTEARHALQDSATLLATYFVVASPTTIVYTVTGESSPASSTLASAGSDLTGTGAGFFATVVQQKIQSGVDANGSAADGEISWNFGNPWALGASVAAEEYDFTSTAMHELLHTFGFLSYTVEPGANTGRAWTTFDQYVVTSDGTRVITDSYRWRSSYDTNLTGGNGGLFFGGTNAIAAYGGPVPLYTPDPWESGSSMSHLDDETFTGAATMLMNAATDTGPGIRVISPVELAILKDLGYDVTSPTPLSALVLIGFGFLRRRGGRAQRPVS